MLKKSFPFMIIKARIEASILANDTKQREADLLTIITEDKDLTPDEKLELESMVHDAINDKEQDTPSVKVDRFFPKYNFGDEFKADDGLIENGFNRSSVKHLPTEYADWLRSEFLPSFLPLPEAEHQNILATIFLLLNPRAVMSPTQDIPIPYILGSNGSGKSEFGKILLSHYPRHLGVEIRPNNTGASIRDLLDNKFGHGDIGAAVFDNFNPRIFMERAGNFYDLILATNEEASVSRVSSKSNEDGKSEYRTYCYKIFNSVFSLEDQGSVEFGEIYRRTVTLMFKEAKPTKTRSMYDWSAMSDVLRDIWSGEQYIGEITRGLYAKTLSETMKFNPTKLPSEISGKRWVVCRVPIAVGVYCGLFKDLGAGIQYFADHFSFCKNASTHSANSQVSALVAKYVKEEYPQMVMASQKSKWVPENQRLSMDFISQQDLIKYLTDYTGFAVGKRDINEIITLMANYGYGYGKEGQRIGFFKP